VSLLLHHIDREASLVFPTSPDHSRASTRPFTTFVLSAARKTKSSFPAYWLESAVLPLSCEERSIPLGE
jgi:hypothetical protein